MDIASQLASIRDKKHFQYLQQKNERLKKENEIAYIAKNLKLITHLRQKYHRFVISAIKIQRFIRKNYFSPCINESDISDIPAMYRIRINMKSSVDDSKDTFLRYCFDIRLLHLIQHDVINLYGVNYYVQKKDIDRITVMWNKLNNNNNTSIIYLSNFEYYKSLGADLQIPLTTVEDLENITEFILSTTQIKINDSQYLDSLNLQYFRN